MTRIKRIDLIIWVVMVLIAMAVTYVGSGANEPVRLIRLAAGASDTFAYRVAEDLKPLFERHGPYKVIFVEAANSGEAAGLLRENKADLAIMAPAAMADDGGWVAVAPLASLHVHLIAPRENGVTSLMKIPAEQLDTGSPGSDSAILAFDLRKQLGLVRRDALLIDNVQPGPSAKYTLRVEHPLEAGLAPLLNRKDRVLMPFRDAHALAARDGQWSVSRLPAGIHAYPENQQPDSEIQTLATPLVLAASTDIPATDALSVKDVMSSPAAKALVERLGGALTAKAWDALPKPTAFMDDQVSYERLLEQMLVWWIEHLQVIVIGLLFVILILLQLNWWTRRREHLREQSIRLEAEKAMQELLRIEQRVDIETAMADLVQLRMDLNECKSRLLKRLMGTALMGSPLMLGFLSQWSIVDTRLALTLNAYRPAGKGMS